MSANPKRSGLQHKWNLELVNWFHEALLEHGKDFEKISVFMMKKSIRNIPHKIPNHLNSVGVRYFYYRNLRKASNLLHAYECRHPTAPGLAGVALKKSGQSNFSTTSMKFSTFQNDSTKTDVITTAVSTENKPDDPDSTYSPSDYSLQEQIHEISADKRDDDSSNDLFPVATNSIQPESDDSNVENQTHSTKQLYDKHCQSKMPKEQSEVSKRDLTKEWVQVEGFGRCSLDLIAVICYTKLHTILGEKITYRNKYLTHRITSYLGELVYKGATKYRSKGHIKRIKLPNCKVLKAPSFPLEHQRVKLANEDAHTSANNSDSSGDEQPTSTTNFAILHKPKRTKFRGTKNLTNSHSTQTELSSFTEHDANRETICIELIPRDDMTFKVVQSIAQNPYLRIFVAPSTFFADISNLVNSKWKKIFSRSGDLTVDFDFEYPCSRATDLQYSNQIIQDNHTIRDLLINRMHMLAEPVNMETTSLRLVYRFCTNYEHVLTDGISCQISPLTALVHLLRTINKSDRKGSKIPIGKNFPRKFTGVRDNSNPTQKGNTKNVITRSLLKNTLEKLRQMHASKHPSNSNSTLKIEQLKRLTTRPNSSALKYLVEYLRKHNDKLRKNSSLTRGKTTATDVSAHFPNLPCQKSKTVRPTYTRSVPSSFHSVLKEKATSRSLFSSEVTEQPNDALLNYEYSPRGDMQRWVDDLSIENMEPVNEDFQFNFRDTNNPEYTPELSCGTFSMLADAYFGVDAENTLPQETDMFPETFEGNCPSVVSENFQSLLSELDGMVQEWESDEVYNTDTEVLASGTDPVLAASSVANPAKMFLKYFLNSHESDSEDKVMRSIFEDDSLDGLGSQQVAYNGSSNFDNNNNTERNTM